MNKTTKTETKIAIGIEDLIQQIGEIAEKNMEKADSQEEQAFLLGHVNFSASLLYALRHAQQTGIKRMSISLDYEEVLKEYLKSKAKQEEPEETEQISMAELFPKLFAMLLAENKKPSKPKKSTKKD